jgi:sigma-B regulation protein RsbU (phosphoserine phosphatase)
MENKGKKFKIRSFGRRLMRRIGIAQLIVMGLASYFIYIMANHLVKDEESNLYESYLREANLAVSRVLSEVQVSTSNRVSEIQDHLGEPDRLADIMRRIVETNPRVRSCGLSFVDNYFPKKGRWFCPYAVRPDSGAVETRIIGSAQQDYLQAEWFLEALAADSAYWSKPFFDATDSVTPLTAYMIPIHDKKGKTVAILGADLKLDLIKGHEISGVDYNGNDVKLYINNNQTIDVGDDERLSLERGWRFISYNFIIDSDGTFIAHPDSGRILKDNYFELAKTTNDTIDDHLGKLMVAGKSGSYRDERGRIEHFDFFDQDVTDSYVFYSHIAHTSWSIGLVVPRFLIDALALGMGLAFLILIGLGLLAGSIVGRFVIKRMVRPLTKLADSANEVAKGNFSVPLPKMKHNDEIRLLRDSFEGMQHSLKEYIEELKDTTASKAAIENELKVAHDIQMSMLPKTFPPYPERDDVDIYGMLTPAKDVGGDLFDFYIRDEKLFFCIGDVSGKGIPASLVMAMTRSLFRNISLHVSEPNVIMRGLNAAVADGNDTNMFVTLFLGVLDLHTGVLQYCNAGHDSPLLIGGIVRTLDCDSNLPIGVLDDWAFTLQEIQLESPTTIFLYTDGLNEAEDSMHAQFGEGRILRVAESQMAAGIVEPAVIVSQMQEAVHRFVDEAEQSDDMTMLAIKYTKK